MRRRAVAGSPAVQANWPQHVWSCRVFPGHVQAIQKPGHGTGHLRGALIQEAGDEELDDGFPYKCHVSIIELIDISVLSNRKPKTENRKLA